ncbi:hypothetical protein THF1C08_160009 [Vibrio jasicida]|uniref:Uncharacterized protein n=1 Tax=Vibrio jasicida TaxID=766224 RepID=A0AAU9QGR4_9VIBR|nr:hypothetical protein THF1C08_160009 [Vibrio jasicida]CAH1576203.1 hypothetical protein THF1A12_140009 [Vibrio jasicida]
MNHNVLTLPKTSAKSGTSVSLFLYSRKRDLSRSIIQVYEKHVLDLKYVCFRWPCFGGGRVDFNMLEGFRA